jgi:hypothetical protein
MPSLAQLIGRPALALSLCLGLGGCQVFGLAPAATAPATGRANVTALLPTGTRHVAGVEYARAVKAQLSFTGIGQGYPTYSSYLTPIPPDWQGWSYPQTVSIGAPDPVTGQRSATFANVPVPVGDRRIFRVFLLDANDNRLEELWGVADIPAAAAAPVPVTLAAHTTPVAKVFRELELTADAPRALALDVAQVQTLVDDLLNYDSASTPPGAKKRPAEVQYHPSMLDASAVALAVANGGPGGPYTVPAYTSFASVPVSSGAVTVTALDAMGHPLTTGARIQVSDPASDVFEPVPDASGTVATFPRVTTGNWTATVTDGASGRRASGPVNVGAGMTRDVALAVPLAGPFETVVGVPGPAAATSGYPHETALSAPAKLLVTANALFWVDAGTLTIKRLKLDGAYALVETIAGNGTGTTTPAAENALATTVPLGINFDTTLALDEQGRLLFSEPAANRIAALDLTTGQLSTFWTPPATLTAWPVGQRPGAMAYDAATQTLYVGGGSLFEIDLSPAAAPPLLVGYMDGAIALSAQALLYSNGSQIHRRDRATGTDVVIAGRQATFPYDDLERTGLSAPAVNYGGIRYTSFALDALGNLYGTRFLLRSPLDTYRVVRISRALDPEGTTPPWYATYMGTNASAVAVSPDGFLYTSGNYPLPNPINATTLRADAIQRIKLR